MPFLEKLFELIMQLIASCPAGRRDTIESQIRTPSRLMKWLLKRRAKKEGLTLSESDWEDVYAIGRTMSQEEIQALISEAWSAF